MHTCPPRCVSSWASPRQPATPAGVGAPAGGARCAPRSEPLSQPGAPRIPAAASPPYPQGGSAGPNKADAQLGGQHPPHASLTCIPTLALARPIFQIPGSGGRGLRTKLWANHSGARQAPLPGSGARRTRGRGRDPCAPRPARGPFRAVPPLVFPGAAHEAPPTSARRRGTRSCRWVFTAPGRGRCVGPGGRGCGPLRGRRSSWAPGGWGRTHLPGWRPPGAPCGRQGLGGARAAASSPGPGAPAAAAATRPRLPAQRIGAAAGGPRRRGGARGAGRAAAPGPCSSPPTPPPPRSLSQAPQHRCGPAPPRARPLPAPAPEDPLPRGGYPLLQTHPDLAASPNAGPAPAAPARALIQQPRRLPSVCSPPQICGPPTKCRRSAGYGGAGLTP